MTEEKLGEDSPTFTGIIPSDDQLHTTCQSHYLSDASEKEEPPLTIWQRIQAGAIRFVESKAFNYCITVCIFAASILLAVDLDYEDEPIWYTVLEHIFLYIFTLEVIIKVVAYPPTNRVNGYHTDLMNWVDVVVVIEGWLSLILEGSGSDYSGQLMVSRK